MLYGDEEIIRRRVAAQAKKRHVISNEVEIGGVKYAFARREFELGFSMVVPALFEEMSSEAAGQLFPHEGRPKLIISSNDFTVCIAFNSGDMQDESIKERVSAFGAYIKKLNPSNVFFTQGVYDLWSDMRVGYYDYRYPAIDEDLYNFTFVTDLPDMELLGWFICPVDLQEKWEPLIRQMVQTIEIVEKGE